MSRSFAIVIFVSTSLLASNLCVADEKPGVVCESDVSGVNMVCRDAWLGEDAAPFRRVAPAAPAPVGAAPKQPLPMLAPPPARETSAAQAPAYLRKGDVSRRVEPTLPAKFAPAIAEHTPSNTTTKPLAEVVKPVANPLPPPPAVIVETETTPPRAASSAATTAQAVATTPPAFVIKEPVAAAPIVTPPAEAATQPPVEPVVATPQPLPVEMATSPPTAVATTTSAVEVEPHPVAAPAAAPVALLDGAAFHALDGSHYTLELANAKSPDSLRELAARLQLPGAVYLIHLRSPESDRWLLTWADHASQPEARSARQLVPADATINSGWPRRIAPLQNELVSP